MAWNPSLSLNPEFVRALRTTLPRRRALFVAGLTAVLLLAGAWVVWNRSAPAVAYDDYSVIDRPVYQAEMWARQVKGFGSESYVLLTVLLFALLFVLGPAAAGLSFVQERLRGTAIFQQMSLLSPFRLAAGKFWGAGTLAYFVALLLLPFALGAAWLGGVEWPKVARLYLFLLVGGFTWQALGLYASAALSGAGERAPRGGLLVGPLVAVGGAVTALALAQFFTADYELMARELAAFAARDAHLEEYTYNSYQSYWWYFYGARVPAYAVVLGLVGFTGLWGFAGVVRRVKVWQLVPVSARPAWLFFGSACALLTGLLWGRYFNDTVPVFRLNIYMLLCWGAMAALAGASALTRGRLREWWSAERDPLALLQRSEIKGSLATILAAAGFSLAGLFALWMSYHVHPLGNRPEYKLGTQFLPIALSFALTLCTTAAFVQLCAMFRFRLGGWAGVALLAFVYIFAGVAGAMLDKPDNTPALLNPLTYAETVTKGDYYLDSIYSSLRWSYEEADGRPVAVSKPADYEPRTRRSSGVAAPTARGLAAEGGFALLCLVLATLKWRQTRREMLHDPGD